ncbi:hypothetical protein BO83DRAFT_203406 [Aspergillus eucalypticola CBS 122712]|uniref:BTB domain-containing protein n=1 Tax=Aspergillus eucalypticola (strain CBS 122712 / IBT 29274) TaxID=1448314 RepID=A0A317W7H2_ASPEC|nr:uncharacterized protein BO83DRAFT_203406 [Aspergillus eucalypticola CBS 122712]PWY80100.1 hypothetical protein BO83DRAFT_203406 [Aspergillus eucalypticola CBS 122712]
MVAGGNTSNMSARYTPNVKPEFDDDLEEYEQPELSPYETRLVIVLLGPSERKFSIPEYYLKQSPVFADILSTYPNFITRTTPCIALPDIDDDITHTIVHYLHTGTYQTLRHSGDWTKTEYRRSVLAYAAASKYELSGLLTLSKKYMQKLDKDLSIFDVLSVARKAITKIPDWDQWFFSVYVRSRLAAAFDEDEDLFESPRFQYLLGAEPGFVTCLVQAMVAIYEAKLSELKQYPRINGYHHHDDQDENHREQQDHEISNGGYMEPIPTSPGRNYNKAVIFIEETMSDRQPSEGGAPSDAGYPDSIQDEHPLTTTREHMEAFPELTDDVYVPEAQQQEERYAPTEETIVEEPSPEPETKSHALEKDMVTERWGAWRNWANKDRDWYRNDMHDGATPEKPTAVPEQQQQQPPPIEDPVPEYPEMQRSVTEETAATENVPPAENVNVNGKKLGKKSRKKKMRALFSSAEEPKAELQTAY